MNLIEWRHMRFLYLVIVFLCFIRPVAAADQDAYAPLTPKTLAQLYWAMEVHRTDNFGALDEFALLTQCQIYNDFHENEVEWAEIRKALQAVVTKEKPTYQKNFSLTYPMNILPYDIENRNFPLNPDQAFINTDRLEVRLFQSQKQICGIDPQQLIYITPHFIVKFLDPLTIDKVPLKSETAKDLIQQYPQRIVYIKLSLEALQYRANASENPALFVPDFLVRVNGYEVYADPKQKIRLMKVDF